MFLFVCVCVCLCFWFVCLFNTSSTGSLLNGGVFVPDWTDNGLRSPSTALGFAV